MDFTSVTPITAVFALFVGFCLCLIAIYSFPYVIKNILQFASYLSYTFLQLQRGKMKNFALQLKTERAEKGENGASMKRLMSTTLLSHST